MAKQLIIVESPAKVKTITKFLGAGYTVQASVGHVCDLPTKKLGVDEANDFAPQYEIIEKKQKVVDALRTAAAKAETVYLAPDPDREGEAIAWHVARLIKDQAQDIRRIEFNEITARAVKEALAHPRQLNERLFDAQQARRVLDRLVGYKISPLLWNTVKRGISAGRVQSVALRLIVDRETERRNFKSEEYWVFKASVQADVPPPFTLELAKINKKKAEIKNAEQAEALEQSLQNQPFIVASVTTKERERAPQPPFITSSLQQTANQTFSYSAKRVMSIAQKLYEGVELGEKGLTAMITYMRTDSVRVSKEAQKAAHDFIDSTWGKEYLPPKTRVYKSKGSAQDAHEAIRPVDVTLTPEAVKGLLPAEQYNLYKLIWSRFVASQMASAKIEDTVVQVTCAHTLWKTKGERELFPGFNKALTVATKEKKVESTILPPLQEGQILQLLQMNKEQKFTQPPARYSEASLVRELEEKGIGRPSTYATIISTLQDRKYVQMEEKRFVPTDLGTVVCAQLVENFSELMDVGFTAQMETNLDQVAEGDLNWVDLLRNFATYFNPALASATQNMKSVKAGLPSGLTCPQCGKEVLIKFGKNGAFLACAGYPKCHYTSDFIRKEDGRIEAVATQPQEQDKVGQCPECGKDLVLKRAHTGSRFIACTGYPECKYAAPFSIGVVCPKCGQGQIVEKSSRRGKIFYSCSCYPQCDFALWNKPVPEKCPLCDSVYLVEKKQRGGGVKIVCPNKNCSYVKEEPEEKDATNA